MHLERVFAVPKDAQIDRISGKFEGGCLSLFMPKEEVPKTAVATSQQTSQNAKPEGGPPTVPKTEGPPTVPKTEGPPTVPKTEGPPTAVSSKDATSQEPSQIAKPAAADKEGGLPTQKDQSQSSARTVTEPTQKDMAQGGMGTKASAPVKPLTDEKKEEHLVKVSDDRFEKHKKKGLAWKETIVEEVEWWLDDGLMDGLLETISKNKKFIAIAVAAFSVGFFVSLKMKSSGR